MSSTQQHTLKFPVMLDNDYAYWKRLGNRYWPTFYLVNKAGAIEGVVYGETHANTVKAQQAEAKIEALLAEKNSG